MDMELIMGVVKIIVFCLVAVPLMAVVIISTMLFVLAFGIVCHWIMTRLKGRR